MLCMVLMFNADPDAAALKQDETWYYMAELIRRHARRAPSARTRDEHSEDTVSSQSHERSAVPPHDEKCLVITVKALAVGHHSLREDMRPLYSLENTCASVSVCLPVCHLDCLHYSAPRRSGEQGGAPVSSWGSGMELWQVDNTWMNNSNRHELAE